MNQIITAYLQRMHRIHEDRPICKDTAWVIKILYEWQRLGRDDGTDIQRDIIYHAEQIEPDKAKWDISAEDYQEALAELLKKHPRMIVRNLSEI